MPTTRQLVSTIINDYLPRASRPKVLAWLDRAQRRLFDNDCAQSTFLNWNDASFPVPILSTTAGTLSYTLSASNLVDSAGTALTPSIGGYNLTPRKIKDVFIMTASLPGYNDRLFYGEEFDWIGINEIFTKRLYRVTFERVPCFLMDRTDARGATVQFAEDPGTATDKYFVEFYYEPLELTAETIPLTISSSEWEQALIDGTVGFAEDADSGRSERLQKFETYWIPKFIRKMNANVTSRSPMQMRIRECG